MNVSPAERQDLDALAAGLNRRVERGADWDRPGPTADPDRLRPGDDFNARAEWEDVLAHRGWQAVRRSGDVVHWRRPGKDQGSASATTGFCKAEDGDLLYVFSTGAAPFREGKCYSRFAAYTLLEHAGDFRAAAAALRAKGFGGADGPAPAGPGNGHAVNGRGGPAPPAAAFPVPVPASQLRRSTHAAWILNGYLAPGAVTLLTALWKAGKTTLLSHLLRQMESGGTFCGRVLGAGRVLMVTEESENRWAERRDALGLHDHVSFLIRPFRTKPDWPAWNSFLLHLRDQLRRHPADLVVFDPLVNLWPVKDENDASQVQACLMPLHQITTDAGLLLAHHNRKSDGMEATAARGSGALSGFVDIIVELRRFDPADRKDRRRVLTGYGRYDETPGELVVELGPQGYVALGDRREASCRSLADIIRTLLPGAPPGMTTAEILDNWPEDATPGRNRFLDTLRQGADEGFWTRDGDGTRGSPYLFWRAPR